MRGGNLCQAVLCICVSVLAILLLSTLPVQAQTTWYVDDNAPNDPGPGDPTVSDPLEDGSAAHPYDAIQEGIDASVDYDTVMVADGTYAEDGNRDLDFAGRLITVRSENGPENCIIECDGTYSEPHRGFLFHSGGTLEAVVQGFTIQNGYGGIGGGAIRLYDYSAATIIDNIMTGNASYPRAGALEVLDSTAWIENNTFINNYTTSTGGSYGGALWCYTDQSLTVLNNTFTGNTTGYGGAVYVRYSPLIAGNTFTGNTAIHDGGAMFVEGYQTDAVISDNLFEQNVGNGGGIYCRLDAHPVIANNHFISNDSYGIAFSGCNDYSGPILVNNLFTLNLDSAIYSSYSVLAILNNTIHDNGAAGIYGDLGSLLTVSDTITWANNGAYEIELIGSEDWPSSLSISYCDVDGGQPAVNVGIFSTLDWGTGNFNSDPLFVTGPHGDHYLSQTSSGQGSDSPCLNTGSDSASNICFTNQDGTVCLDEITTRTDNIDDAGQVDMGFHYPTELTVLVPEDYGTIQEAIDNAYDRDTVIVSAGTYLETIDFLGKAITVTSEDGPDDTVIDGNGSGPVVTFHNGEGSDAVLDGFTVTGGLSSGDGGGISCRNGSSPLITGNIVTGNTAGIDGGGILCHTSSPTLTNNVVHGNTADDDGGGIYCYQHTGEIANNLVYGNTSADWGGGIGCSQSNCTISSNTVIGNSSVNSGGGLYLYDSTITAVDTILWDNSSAVGPEIFLGSATYPSTLNIDFSDVDGGQASAYLSSNCTLNWGPGMLNADPLFITGQGGDYYLSQISEGEGSDSPCLDTGSATAASICFTGGDGSFCLDERTTRSGHHDVDTGTVDIGYHHQYWCCDCDGDWYDSEYCGGTDCNDDDDTMYPGATEICDGKDNDCSGSPESNEADVDEDGWMICEGDCNDGDPDMNPGVEESRAAGNCDDGKDNDCDSAPDGADTDCGVTMTASLTCVPGSGTLPFSTQMTVTLNNEYQGLTRRIAGRINVDLANGSSVSNWKSGWSNIDAGSNLISAWNQTIPALGSLVGNNVFTLLAEDVTPSPYNQPPHPPAGDTDTDVCTVVGVAP